MTGQQLGTWILGDELGRGPLGPTFRARAANSDRVAAVKLLTHDAAHAADVLARFPAEMLALHRLNHPNVVRFYDAGVHNGIAWYAAEYVDGTDCAALLKTHTGLNWADDVVRIAVQVARGLKHGHHRSLLHRDLKPSNVLVAKDGTVKLADFGVAKAFNLAPLALPADPMGTAGFTAPEHFQGKPLTRRSDLYALGGVLYALVAGRPPFQAATPAEFLHKHCYMLPDRPVHFVPDLPPDLDDLICALLAKDPLRRPASAAAVIEALDQLRGKQERKGKRVAWPPDPGDASGPMAALTDRDEAAEEDRPRPLMSRPAVVVPLFLAVLAVILAAVFWPRPSADELIAAARPLVESEDPANWDKAWDDYLEPLSSRYPDRYADEVAAARAKILDRKELRRSVDQGGRVKYKTEAERLYHRGRKQAEAGDPAAAKRTWGELAAAFAGVESEARWVRLAEAGLAELGKTPPPAPPDRSALAAAAEKAKADPAARAALEELYRDDPAALEIIRGK